MVSLVWKQKIWEIKRYTVYSAKRIQISSDFIFWQRKLLFTLKDHYLTVSWFQALPENDLVNFYTFVFLSDYLHLDSFRVQGTAVGLVQWKERVNLRKVKLMRYLYLFIIHLNRVFFFGSKQAYFFHESFFGRLNFFLFYRTIVLALASNGSFDFAIFFFKEGNT